MIIGGNAMLTAGFSVSLEGQPWKDYKILVEHLEDVLYYKVCIIPALLLRPLAVLQKVVCSRVSGSLPV